MKKITTLEQLDDLYGEPSSRSLWKEIDYINDHYKAFIEHSPFLILATSGPKGIDCSPRGDPPGFVRVVNKRLIQIPDRRGNNRLDSLRNIVINANVGVIFIIPNAGETIRLTGQAEILVDKTLCESFSMHGKPASSVLSISVEKVYFQCQKAIARAKLWDTSSYIERSRLPSPGEMTKVFANLKDRQFDAEAYDRDYPERMKNTIY